MLTRDELVKQRTKEITIDGGTVVIRALTASEALELRGKDLQGPQLFGIIAMSMIDPQLTAEDVGMLPASVVTPLVTGIFEFNALGKKAIEDAKNELKKTEDLTTNSAAS